MATTEELLLRITGDSTGGQQAVQQMADGLQGLGGHGKDVGAQLAHAFEHPMDALKGLGDAMKDQLLGSLGSMAGIAASAGAALSAVGVAAFGLAEKAAAIGGHLNDMSEKTGVSVEALSRLQNAAQVAGSDLGTMSNALFMLQKGLGEDSEKVAGGLRKIGLTTEELKAAGPDQYMALIAEHFRATTDPAARAAAAVEIFNRQGREIIPTLMKLDEALTKTGDIDPWTTQQAAEAERFEMQMASLKEHVSAVAVALGRNLIPAAAATVDALVGLGVHVQHILDLGGLVSGSYHLLAGALGETALAAETAGAKQDVINTAHRLGAPLTITYGDAVRYVNEKFADLHPAQDKATTLADAWIKKLSESAKKGMEAAASDAELTDGLARMGIVRGGGIEQLNEETAAHKKAADEARKHADEQHKLANELLKVEHSLRGIPDALQKIGRSYDESKLGTLVNELGKIERNAHIATFGFKGMTDELTNVGYRVAKTGDELDDFARFNWAGPIQQRTQTLGEDMTAVFKKVPQMVTNALTGGGGIVGAMQGVGSMAGAALGENLGKRIASLGSMGGPIGAAIGSLAGPIIGFFAKVFSGGAEHMINPVREAFVQAAGGLAALDAKAHAAGVTLTALLNAKNPEQYKKAIDDLNVALALQNARQAFIDLNGGLVAMDIKAHTAGVTLDKMLDAKTPEAYKKAIDDLSAAFKFQDDSMKVLDDTVKKYGLKLEDLGPAYRKGKLDEDFKTLFQDQKVLSAAGVDYAVILGKQAPKFQDLIDIARKTGTAIPLEMKPAIEKMIELGLLTDDSGKKMTDVSKLTFAETLDTKFQTIIDKIGLLVDAITRGLGPAIQNIPAPAPIRIPIVYDYPRDHGAGAHGEVDGAWRGGLVTPHGVQYLASGLAGLMAPRGTDTVPAMLTPGESVLTRAATSALGPAVIGMLNRGGGFDVRKVSRPGGGDVTINVHVDASRAFFRTREDTDRLATEVGDALMDQLRQATQLSLRQ